MVKIWTFCLCGFICAAASAARAQVPAREAGSDDSRRITEEAMKSRNYSQDQAENWDARLKSVSGTVSVKTAGKEEWSKIDGELPLSGLDWIKTGSDGIAELYLDAKGAFYIGRNTELQLSSIDQTDTVMTLKAGSLAGKMTHLLNNKFKTQVRTPAAVCTVSGSEFAVEYSQLGKDTGAGTFDEGRVTISPFDDSGNPGEEYVLEKNMELFFNPSQKRLRPVQLSRMSRHRTEVAAMRTRLAALRKSWRPVSAAERRDMRDLALKRKVLHKQLVSGTARAKNGKKNRLAGKAKGVRRKKTAKQPPEAPQEEIQEDTGE